MLDLPGLPEAPGVHDLGVRLATGADARFTLSLPRERDPAPPLVLVLHYAGEPTPYYGRPLLETLVEPALRTLNAVFVAPETLGGAWHTEANEAWVLALLDGLAARYTTDPLRVVVTGYSMGAMGTWHLLGHHPERFSAAVPISGFPRQPAATRVPVYALHAPRDELFDFERLRTLSAELIGRGCPLHLESVPATGHFDLQGFAAALARVPAWLAGVWSGAAPGEATTPVPDSPGTR